jgi:FkbM family methyltransferase
MTMSPTTGSRSREFLKAASRNRALQGALRPLGHAGILPERAWSRLRVGCEFQVAGQQGCTFRYRSVPEDFVGMQLYWRGTRGWEREVIARFIEAAKTARGFVDVGANTGVYMLIGTAVNDQLRCLAFEPVPRNVTRIREHLELNRVTEQVEVHQSAVSDQSGTAVFVTSDNATPSDGRLESHDGPPLAVKERFEVDVVTLDDCVPNDFPVDVLKIDVEGGEEGVIGGATRTIERCRPLIFIEYVDGAPAAKSFLHDLGYRFVSLDERNTACEPS